MPLAGQNQFLDACRTFSPLTKENKKKKAKPAQKHAIKEGSTRVNQLLGVDQRLRVTPKS